MPIFVYSIRSIPEKSGIFCKFHTNITASFDIMKNKERNLKEAIEKILEDAKESETFTVSKKCNNQKIIDIAKRMRKTMVDDGTNVISVLDDGSIVIIG